jgi:predicted RNase H-like HicB family nuclease
LEATRRFITEAIGFHIEGLKLHGYQVPAPSTHAEDVDVEAA